MVRARRCHATPLLVALMLAAPRAAGGEWTDEQRLVVVNGCGNMDVWVASSDGVPGPRNVRLAPGQSYGYVIPFAGLKSTRFWPKMMCDDQGMHCRIGSSGGEGQDCPVVGCAPPVDSKFEATFGCVGAACTPGVDVNDWWDTSAVDGFTVPYKVEVDGKCPGAKVPDCSKLTLDSCPSSEDVGTGTPADLRVRHVDTDEVVGCYSPCGKLTYSNWNSGEGMHSPQDAIAVPYCCPTPPMTPDGCRNGPVVKTSFVQLIHQKCANVYGYAYDDLVGLQVCPAGTRYTWTIMCPGATAPPVIA